jgi:tripartite-type tricarboxylate transporter receptor subunit TctC
MRALLARLGLAAAIVVALASATLAQNYPNRLITLVVPFAAGGPADYLARILGQKMSEDLGQQIIVSNRPGANTIIARRPSRGPILTATRSCWRSTARW